MTKISSMTALLGAGVTQADDLIPIVDMSEAGAARNKKITVAELLALAFSNEVVDDRVAALLTAGTNITLTYDDGAGTLTIDAATPSTGDITGFNEAVDDRVGALIDAGSGISITYDDVAGTLTITNTGAGASFATAAEFRTGTGAAKALTPSAGFDAADSVALTPGANVSVDLATGFNFTLAMGGNYTLDNPTNGKAGQCGVIEITQDGTGSRTLAYGTAWKFAGGTDPALTTTASAKDLLFYQVLADGTAVFANLVKAVA